MCWQSEFLLYVLLERLNVCLHVFCTCCCNLVYRLLCRNVLPVSHHGIENCCINDFIDLFVTVVIPAIDSSTVNDNLPLRSPVRFFHTM
jgi:hypothetical protein